MKKIIILGSSGMLGSQMFQSFKDLNKYKIYYTTRDKNLKSEQNHIFFDILDKSIDLEIFSNADFIINCIGVTKPFIDKSITDSIFINSIFPHRLCEFCQSKNIKLIHITTDCVFSGNSKNYKEDSFHDCIDVYGKSKSLGEPSNCMVIRTSIIGIEKNNFVHLLSWVISQKDKEVNGFKNHLWNGVTTNYLSEVVEKIIDKNLYEQKLFHIHSPNDISKYELLNIINFKFKLNLKINSVDAPISINRTLRSNDDLTKFLCNLEIDEQINSL